MNLKIITAGIFDTIQDPGRYGFQDLGINPGGSMDLYSSQLCNALLGKPLNSPVLELHFPSSKIFLEKGTIVCLTGADFTAMIESKIIPVGQPFLINRDCTLHFNKINFGARCYLSALQEMDINKWLNSYSTNVAAEAGGHKGRVLKKDDIIYLKNNIPVNVHDVENYFTLLKWGHFGQDEKRNNQFHFIKAGEWDWMSEDSKKSFANMLFKISNDSNRMGYRLIGDPIKTNVKNSMISSSVAFGTIQLLPSGQLIVLMADHQTTGGYPRIGNVTSTDLPGLSQKRPGEIISFTSINQNIAEKEWINKLKELNQIMENCKIKMKNYLDEIL